MSLQARITDFAQAVGADIKALSALGDLVRESIPSGEIKSIPAGYQLQVHGALDVSGTLDIEGKLILL